VPNGNPSKPLNKEQIYSLLEEVCDPEIPVLSILDLGIVRDVVIEPQQVTVIITPTYSGCPAMDVIAMDIKLSLRAKGVPYVNVKYTLEPAWTTDWMSESGKEKLKAYGIAPPQRKTDDANSARIQSLLFEGEMTVPCPRCQSENTTLMSEFGSTACKSLYQCDDCKEPFDHFKCH
jgi:ring-1,2-phenylacetyl-CoA epoxidase subunit PaaD